MQSTRPLKALRRSTNPRLQDKTKGHPIGCPLFLSPPHPKAEAPAPSLHRHFTHSPNPFSAPPARPKSPISTPLQHRFVVKSVALTHFFVAKSVVIAHLFVVKSVATPHFFVAFFVMSPQGRCEKRFFKRLYGNTKGHPVGCPLCVHQ